MERVIKTDILIVGAGPTGLSLACQFVRYGVDFVIVEKNEGITSYSKAIGVQARTLEIFDQIGLARKAIEEGTIGGKARLLTGGEIRGELDFSNIGRGLSPFPFVLMLEQSKTERLLYEYLQNHQKDVLWKTELETFSQSSDGIAAQVRNRHSESRKIAAKYLVGCDGPKSLVRHQLGLAFEGSTFERIFYVADARIEWHLGHDALHIFFSKDSFVIFFPLKGERRYRVVGVFPEEFNKYQGKILYEQIEARIKEEVKLAFEMHGVEWFSTYKVHTRHAHQFSAGKGFVAGDAAHIHTPAGAQGMNTGIQDAYNLAWKIALVLQGKADEGVLETYNEERLENAKRLLKTTDRLFEFAAGTEWLLTFLRTNVLPSVANSILNWDAVKTFVFPLISQTGIHYRHSSLSDPSGDEKLPVKAGDRMPYFLVDGKSIYDRLREPKFHYVIFSDTTGDSEGLKSQLETEFPGLMDVHILPLHPKPAEIFRADKSLSVLLRPDNHIAFITTYTSAAQPRAYFKRLLIGS